MDFDNGGRSTAQVIKAMGMYNGLSVPMLAEKLGVSRQNLSNKLKRNNFSESELREIADALGYDLIITFKERVHKKEGEQDD